MGSQLFRELQFDNQEQLEFENFDSAEPREFLDTCGTAVEDLKKLQAEMDFAEEQPNPYEGFTDPKQKLLLDTMSSQNSFDNIFNIPDTQQQDHL